MSDDHIPYNEMEERDPEAWKILQQVKAEKSNRPTRPLKDRCGSRPGPDYVWVQFSQPGAWHASGAWLTQEQARRWHMQNSAGGFIKGLFGFKFDDD